jgi:hypothetical protein
VDEEKADIHYALPRIDRLVAKTAKPHYRIAHSFRGWILAPHATAATTTRKAPMIDSSRRTILTTGAAAAATAAAPQVFAQAPQGAPAGARTGFYEKSSVRMDRPPEHRIVHDVVHPAAGGPRLAGSPAQAVDVLRAVAWRHELPPHPHPAQGTQN